MAYHFWLLKYLYIKESLISYETVLKISLVSKWMVYRLLTFNAYIQPLVFYNSAFIFKDQVKFQGNGKTF